MNEQEFGVRITFVEMPVAEANRATAELHRSLLDRVGDDVAASIHKDDGDSQDGGSTLVLLFGTSGAVAIAQGIRARLARRGDAHDRITIKTADGTQVIATREAARILDAAAPLRAARQVPREE
jgi:hypothetical protein